MRLWHEDLIHKLPRQQLLGQHRECCALRGAGWMRPHRTVNYVFAYPFEYLIQYHLLVMEEMQRRGYQVNPLWLQPEYRGQRVEATEIERDRFSDSKPIYAEHDAAYLQECVDNLKNKGVVVLE